MLIKGTSKAGRFAAFRIAARFEISLDDARMLKNCQVADINDDQARRLLDEKVATTVPVDEAHKQEVTDVSRG